MLRFVNCFKRIYIHTYIHIHFLHRMLTPDFPPPWITPRTLSRSPTAFHFLRTLLLFITYVSLHFVPFIVYICTALLPLGVIKDKIIMAIHVYERRFLFERFEYHWTELYQIVPHVLGSESHLKRIVKDVVKNASSLSLKRDVKDCSVLQPH